MNILCGVPFWSCVGSQGKQLLALLSVSSYLCVGLNLALVTLRCCFHQDYSNCVLEPTVGAMEAPQTLAWPTSHVYMPTKPTAAKARPFPPAGALFALWNILQVLNLGSQQQRCNSSL